MTTSLQRRLLYTYMSVILVLLFAIGITISVLISNHLIASRQQLLISKGQEVAAYISGYARGQISESDVYAFINNIDSALNARVWVLDNAKNVTAVSQLPAFSPAAGVRALTQEIAAVYKGNTVSTTIDHPLYGEEMMIIGVPLKNEAGIVDRAIMIYSPMHNLNELLSSIQFHIVLLGLFVLVLTLFIIDWLSASIAKPLKAMEETASALAQGNYGVRVEVRSDDEVGQLGKSLNTLAQDLNTLVRQTEATEKMRRDFIANVSHELRTPITIIRGYNEALMDYGAVTDCETTIKYLLLINDETIRLERLIKDLLDLSRLQSGNTALETERIPLNAISKSVVTMLWQQADQRGVALRLGENDPVEIRANGDRLIQLLVILIDNAIRYTPPGGQVTVSVKAEENGAVLIIEDTGVGIPVSDLPHIWERFYKVDKAHTRSGPGTGTGIGLALAKQIIELHGATAEVDSRLGQGTVFKISFR